MRSSERRLVAGSVVLAGAQVFAAVLLVVRPWGTDGSPDQLSHTAVESYIATQFRAADVRCNGGDNMPAVRGSSYTCTDRTGQRFTVRIASGDGQYVVERA